MIIGRCRCEQWLRWNGPIQRHNIQGSIRYRTGLRWWGIGHDQMFGIWRNAHIKDPVISAGGKYWHDLTCCKIQCFYAYEEGNIASGWWTDINQAARQVQACPSDWYGCSERRRSCMSRDISGRRGRCSFGEGSRNCWWIEINGAAI